MSSHPSSQLVPRRLNGFALSITVQLNLPFIFEFLDVIDQSAPFFVFMYVFRTLCGQQNIVS